ncbi:MAG TPA: DUF929 family protein [Acidimicrobiales bacterium]|nr:DUF929 family protein [Acidimicrobiales bacterium]
MAKTNRRPTTVAPSKRPAGPKPAARPAPPRRARPVGRRSSTYVWVAGLVVVAVVVSLVLVKVTSGPSAPTPVRPAPEAVVRAATSVPMSTLEAVGTNQSFAKPPTPIHDVPLVAGGKPEVLFIGAEYCPYCAAARWSLVVALSKFGTFSSLGVTASSSTDVDPNTPTFSFYGSHYSSPYLTFTPVEVYSNKPNGSGGYTSLQNPTPQQMAVWNKYGSGSSGGSSSSASNGPSFPFIDFGNSFVTVGAPYDPAVLQGLSLTTIAGSLADPSTQVAQNVGPVANNFIAAICKITNQQPSAVCSAPVIKKAMAALGR